MSSRLDNQVSSETRDFIRTAYSRDSTRLVASKTMAPSRPRVSRENPTPKAVLELPTHYYSGKDSIAVTEADYQACLGGQGQSAGSNGRAGTSSKAMRTRTASTNNLRRRANTTRSSRNIELPPLQTPPAHQYQLFNMEKHGKQQYTMDHYHEDAKTRAIQRGLIGGSSDRASALGSVFTSGAMFDAVEQTESVIERNMPQYSYGNTQQNSFLKGDWVTVDGNVDSPNNSLDPVPITSTTEYVLQFLETGPVDVDTQLNPHKQPHRYRLVSDVKNTRVERLGANSLDIKKLRSNVSDKQAKLELGTLKRSFTTKTRGLLQQPETQSVQAAHGEDPLKIISKMVSILGKPENDSVIDDSNSTSINGQEDVFLDQHRGHEGGPRKYQVLPVRNTAFVSSKSKKLTAPPVHAHVHSQATKQPLLSDEELRQGVMKLNVLTTAGDNLQCSVTNNIKSSQQKIEFDGNSGDNEGDQPANISCVRNVPMVTPSVYVVDGGAVRATPQQSVLLQGRSKIVATLAESQKNIGWAADKRTDTRDQGRALASKRAQRKTLGNTNLRADLKLQGPAEYASRLQDTAAQQGGKSGAPLYSQVFAGNVKIHRVHGHAPPVVSNNNNNNNNNISSIPDKRNLVAWIFSVLKALPAVIDAAAQHRVQPSQPHGMQVRKAARINELRSALLKLRVQANIPSWLWQLQSFQSVLKLRPPALAVKSLDADPSERSRVIVDLSTEMLTRSAGARRNTSKSHNSIDYRPTETRSSVLRASTSRQVIAGNNTSATSIITTTASNTPITTVTSTSSNNATSMHQILVTLSWFLRYSHEINPVSPPQQLFFHSLQSSFNTLALLPNRLSRVEHNVLLGNTSVQVKQTLQKLQQFSASSPIHWLTGLPKDAVSSILKTSVVEHFAPGQVIYTAGAQSVCFYLLVSGVAVRRFGVPNSYSATKYDREELNTCCTCQLHQDVDVCVICSSGQRRPLYVPEFAVKQMQHFGGALIGSETAKANTHVCSAPHSTTFSFQQYSQLPLSKCAGCTFAQEPIGRLYTCSVAEQRRSYITGLWRILRLSIRAAALQRKKDNTNGALVFFSKHSNRYLPLFNGNTRHKKAKVNVVAVGAQSREILGDSNTNTEHGASKNVYFMSSGQGEGLALASLKRHIDILRQPDDDDNLLGVTTTTTALNNNHKHQVPNACMYCYKPKSTTQAPAKIEATDTMVEYTEFSASSGAPVLARLDTVIAATHCKVIRINYLNIDTSQLLLKKHNQGTASQYLHQIPLFQHLSFARLRRLQSVAVLRTYEPGEYLFRQGDPADMLVLVQRGSVRLERSVQVTQVKRHPRQQDQWDCVETTWLETVAVNTLGSGELLNAEMQCGAEHYDYSARAVESKDTQGTTEDALHCDLTESLDDPFLACVSSRPQKPRAPSVHAILIPARHIHYLNINPTVVDEDVARARIKTALIQQRRLAERFPRVHKLRPFPVCIWAQGGVRAPKQDMVLSSSEGLVIRCDPPFTQVVGGNIANPETLHVDPIEVKYTLRADKKNSQRH